MNIIEIKEIKENEKKINYENIYGKNDDILELTYSDFIDRNNKLYIKNNYFTIHNTKKGFIIFYAPWCKHCLKISGLIRELASIYKNIYNIGSVNCENLEDKNDVLAIKANIDQFPTIKIINNDGTLSNFNKEYSLDNLIYLINIS
jgi:thiol-disulfide isomerase/thioredoxin